MLVVVSTGIGGVAVPQADLASKYLTVLKFY